MFPSSHPISSGHRTPLGVTSLTLSSFFWQGTGRLLGERPNAEVRPSRVLMASATEAVSSRQLQAHLSVVEPAKAWMLVSALSRTALSCC